MSSLKSVVASSIDTKIDKFITALTEQLGLDKEDLYGVFNNLSDDSDNESVTSESEVKEEKVDTSTKKTKKDTKEKPAKKDTKTDSKEKTETKQQCEYLFTKGKNSGTRCTATCEGKFCKKHSKDSKEEEDKVTTTVEEKKEGTCEYLFTKGKNQGTKCSAKTDGKYCKKHMKEDEDKVTTKNDKKTKPGSEQKDKEVIDRLVTKNTEKEVKKTEPVLSISKNKFGNYEMVDTGLVFDPKNKQVIGTQNSNGSIDPLTVEDIQLCKEYNFKYLVPDKLKNTTKDSDSEEELESEELDEDMDDDEDMEEYDEEEEDDE